jgi:excinuclease ABC subunit A
LLHGSGAEEIEFTFWRAGKISHAQKPFEGIIPNLERLYVESESEFTKNRLTGFMNPQPCDACGGRRLKPEILAVTSADAGPARARLRAIPGLSIMDVCACPSRRRTIFSPNLKLTEFQQKIAAD